MWLQEILRELYLQCGLLELKDSQLSFEQTVAHEYVHLVFENASRKAGTTSPESDHIEFWPKSAYEGIADMIASMALNTPFTGEPGGWATHNLDEFQTLKDARKAKDSTVSRAKKAFRQIGIIPKYRIYQDWLSKVEQFFKTSGGTDPYAEGTWFAGALLKSANTPEKRNKLIKLLIDSAKIGKSPKDLDLFYQDLIRKLEAFFMSDHGPF